MTENLAALWSYLTIQALACWPVLTAILVLIILGIWDAARHPRLYEPRLRNRSAGGSRRHKGGGR